MTQHAKKTYSWLRKNIAWSFVWGYLGGLLLMTTMRAAVKVMEVMQ